MNGHQAASGVQKQHRRAIPCLEQLLLDTADVQNAPACGGDHLHWHFLSGAIS